MSPFSRDFQKAINCIYSILTHLYAIYSSLINTAPGFLDVRTSRLVSSAVVSSADDSQYTVLDIYT